MLLQHIMRLTSWTPIVLQEPNVFDAAGRPWLKFPRLVCGRAAQLFINMRNTGGMPAHARIEMDSHPCFQLLEGQQVGAGVSAAHRAH
jgi:hypothetical protein